MLIDGLARSYVHRRLRATVTTGLEYASEPVKGPTSHVVEAFQYLSMHIAHIAADDDRDFGHGVVQLRKKRVV
jgi:hypothetical protein